MHFHYAFVGRHLGCFCFLSIEKRLALNTDKRVSMEENVESFEHSPRSGMAAVVVV